MVYEVYSAEETEAIGARLAETIVGSGMCRAFIALDGEMGVGKTVFTRGFASALGISGVKSPTYTIVNEHRSADGVRLYHFDLYRISDADDLASIGYDDYVVADGYCIAEWPSRVPEDIPEDAIRVCISRVPGKDDARRIEIVGAELI